MMFSHGTQSHLTLIRACCSLSDCAPRMHFQCDAVAPGLLCDCPMFTECMQRVKECCIPKASQQASPAHIRNLQGTLARSQRKPLNRAVVSEEEAYFVTGVYSSAQSSTNASRGQAERLLPHYAADAKLRSSKPRGNCTKHKNKSGALTPGLMVSCCHPCCCIAGRFAHMLRELFK